MLFSFDLDYLLNMSENAKKFRFAIDRGMLFLKSIYRSCFFIRIFLAGGTFTDVFAITPDDKIVT